METTQNLLNLKIFTTMSMSKKKFIKDKEYYNLIASIYINDLSYHINFNSLIKRLNFLNCKDLTIINIYSNALPFPYFLKVREENKYYWLNLEENPSLKYYHVELKTFFDLDNQGKFNFNDYFINNNNNLNKSIFIFNGIPWGFIVAAFRINNIMLTFGANSRRGILSPLHLRLAQFITCLEGMNGNTVFSSYHNFASIVAQPFWDTTLDNYNPYYIMIYFEIIEEYLAEKYKDLERKEDYRFKSSYFDFSDYKKFYDKRWQEKFK
uniref:DNA-dependent RNA polymerase n=1 Tax=Clavaria fumosa TaxID=264083 RepID=A0A7T3PCR2_9AGAR|nr:DNA-dependent RNA polymerase [Clavaria fumosa]QPZ51095.1 DNA-dependent RNA polymerase [Clavaria fumosa]